MKPGSIVVGHSVGGALLIHILDEHRPKRKVGAIVLIAAPFISEGGWPADEIEPRTDFVERLLTDVPCITARQMTLSCPRT
jgi:predicted alpha/beta hydrolase family esterase